jgi:RNase P subunit RPR2
MSEEKLTDAVVDYIKRVICPVCDTAKTRIIPNDHEEIKCVEQCLNCGALIYLSSIKYQ